MASVTLSATSVAAGGTVQGTVTLTTAAPSGGTSVTLTSSATAIATVPATVALASGASSATFTVTAVAAGTVFITASANGGQQTASLAVTASAKLATLTLSAATVVGGSPVTGTVTLTAGAPVGGAVVTLTANDPATVPASVTVAGGATSATFLVSTRLVGGTIAATVGASYGGVSLSAPLSVTKPSAATANFGVTGPNETETCEMANNGNTLNCTFNGSTSTAPGNIVAWDWTYTAASTKTFSQTTTGPILTNPTVDCTFLPPPPLPSGATSVPLTITLVVHDDQGNVSDKTIDSGARVLPKGTCGY